MSDFKADSAVGGSGGTSQNPAVTQDEELAQAVRQAIVRRRVTPFVNLAALLGLAYVTYRNGLAMNGPVTRLTGVAMLAVVIIALIARHFRRKPLSKVQDLTGTNIKTSLGWVTFALAMVTAFFLSLTVRSYAFAAEESQPTEAVVYECDTGGRGDPTCQGQWEIDGVHYSGLVPWDPEEPEPGDTISIMVSVDDPSLVTSQENILFVRFGIYFWLAATLVTAGFWLTRARKLTGWLRETASNPRTTRMSADASSRDRARLIKDLANAKLDDKGTYKLDTVNYRALGADEVVKVAQSHGWQVGERNKVDLGERLALKKKVDDDATARRIPGVGVHAVGKLRANAAVANLVSEKQQRTGVDPLSDAELDRVNQRIIRTGKKSTGLVVSAVVSFILALLFLPAVFQVDDDYFYLTLAIFGALILVVVCALLVNMLLRKKMRNEIAAELKTYAEIARLYKANEKT